jgi:hypothetical protein
MRVAVSQTGNLVRRLVYNERRNKWALLMTTANQSRDEWWSPSDLFFLTNALEHGMTCAEVAGFLSRDEDEVREKAKQMKGRHSRHRGLRRGG